MRNIDRKPGNKGTQGDQIDLKGFFWEMKDKKMAEREGCKTYFK